MTSSVSNRTSNLNLKSNFLYFQDEIIKTIETPPFNQTSTLIFRPNRTGLVTCRAVNKQNSTTTSASVILSDLSEDLIIWTNNESPIAIGDEVLLNCGASAHKFSGGIEWFKDDIPIVESAGIKVFKKISHFLLSFMTVISFICESFQTISQFLIF